MADRTVLEYAAEASSLIAELKNILNLSKELDQRLKSTKTLKVEVKQGLTDLERLKKTIDSVKQGLDNAGYNGAQTVLKLSKEFDRLNDLLGRSKAAVSSVFDNSEQEVHPLLLEVRNLKKELDTVILAMNTARTATDFSKARDEARSLIGSIKSLGEEIHESGLDVDGLAKEFNGLASTARSSLGIVSKELKELGTTGSNSTKTLFEQVGRLEEVFRQLQIAIKKGTNSPQALRSLKSLEEALNTLSPAVSSASKDFPELGTRFNALSRSISSSSNDVSKSIKKFNDELRKLGGSDAGTRKLFEEVGLLEKEFIKLRAAIKPGTATSEALGKYKELERRLNELRPSISNISKDFPELEQRSNKLANGITSNSNKIITAIKNHERTAAAAASHNIRNAELEAKRVEEAKRRQAAAFDKLSQNIRNLRTVAGAVIFSRITQEAYQLGKSAVDTAVELQALENAFVALSESPEQARKTLADLREEADTLGVSFLTLAENFLRIDVAARAAGFSAGEAKVIFDSIIVASTGMNQSTQTLNRTLAAFEQIMSKGVLSAEEVRRQLGNAIPGAFSLVARAIGVTEAELEKLLRAGAVLSKEAIPAIADELVKTFGKAAVSNAASARAEFARLENTLRDVRKAIGDGLLPTLTELSRQIRFSSGDLEDLRKGTAASATYFSDLALTLRGLISADPKKFFGGLSIVMARMGVEVLNTSLNFAKLRVEQVASEKFNNQTAESFNNIKNNVDNSVEALRIFFGFAPDAAGVMAAQTKAAREQVVLLQEATRKMREEAKKSKDIKDLMKGLPESIGGTVKSIVDLRTQLEALEIIAKKNKTAMSPVAVRLLAEEFVALRNKMRESGQSTTELDSVMVDLANSLGPAAIAAADAKNAFEEMGIATVTSIEQSADSFRIYLTEVKKGGSVTKEQADIIVENAEKILESIRQLPKAQREGFITLEGSLKNTIKNYRQFTSEAIDNAKELREKTVREYEQMVDAIQGLFEKLEDIIAKKDEEKGGENLKALQEELDSLRDIAILSEDQRARMQELEDQLAGKRVANVGLFTQAVDEGSEIVKEKFEEIILGNERLIQGLSKLSPTAGEQFISLVEGFGQIVESGNATKENLQDFGVRVAQIFEQANIPISAFKLNMQETATLSQKLRAAVSDAGKQTQIESQLNGEQEVSVTSSGFSELSSQTGDAALNLENLNELYIDNGTGLRKLNTSQQDNKKSTEELIEEYVNLRNNLNGNVLSTYGQQKAYERLIEVQDELRSSGDILYDSQSDITQSFEDGADAINLMVSPLTKIARQTDETRREWDRFNESAEKAQGTLEGFPTITNELNTELSNMKIQFEDQSAAVDGLRANQDKFNTTTVDTSRFINQESGALENAEIKAKTFGEELTETGEVGKTAFETLNTGAQSTKDLLRELIGVIQEAKEEFKSLGD
jgi:tape measure domain-containing protein